MFSRCAGATSCPPSFDFLQPTKGTFEAPTSPEKHNFLGQNRTLSHTIKDNHIELQIFRRRIGSVQYRRHQTHHIDLGLHFPVHRKLHSGLDFALQKPPTLVRIEPVVIHFIKKHTRYESRLLGRHVATARPWSLGPSTETRSLGWVLSRYGCLSQQKVIADVIAGLITRNDVTGRSNCQVKRHDRSRTFLFLYARMHLSIINCTTVACEKLAFFSEEGRQFSTRKQNRRLINEQRQQIWRHFLLESIWNPEKSNSEQEMCCITEFTMDLAFFMACQQHTFQKLIHDVIFYANRISLKLMVTTMRFWQTDNNCYIRRLHKQRVISHLGEIKCHRRAWAQFQNLTISSYFTALVTSFSWEFLQQKLYDRNSLRFLMKTKTCSTRKNN